MAKKHERRGHGEGTISLRKDGRWEARYLLANGKRKCLYAKTRREAALKLAEAVRDKAHGIHQIADERLRLNEYLDEWLNHKRESLAHSTGRRYGELLAHVRKMLGDRRLTRLTPADLERLYDDLRNSGLTTTTVHHVHAALHGALADAERRGQIPRNPADLAQAPRVRKTEMRTFTPEQARAFLAAAQDDPLEALYVLALTTGMRQGELLALRWSEIDLNECHLQVRGTLNPVPGGGYSIGPTKTDRSRRRIDLSKEAVAALRRHKVRQMEQHLASSPNERSGNAQWHDLVFTNTRGGPLNARNLAQRSFRQVLERAGVPTIRFHDLRHTAATLMHLQGINSKVVSERLGHSSVGITLDRYSHVLPSMQRGAADAMDRILFSAKA